LVPALPAGSVAYIDRDWLPASSGEVPALVADADGGLAWCGGPSVRIPSGHDSDTAAVLALLAVAQAAVAGAEDAPADSIEPRAIIDITGDPSAIVDATRRVAALGTVALVGEPLERRAEMNLYPDVHMRGLTLVGVSPPLQGAGTLFASIDAGGSLVVSARDALVAPTAGATLPLGAAWYRVSPEPPPT
jgi:hypothetical protein